MRMGSYLAAVLVCSAAGLAGAAPGKTRAPEPRMDEVCSCARADPELTVYLVTGPGMTSMEVLMATMLKCMLRVDGDPQAEIDTAARRGLASLKKHADTYLRAEREAERLAVQRGELTEVERRRREYIRLRVSLIAAASAIPMSGKQEGLVLYQDIAEISTDRIAELEDRRQELLDRASDVYSGTPEIREEALKGAEAYAKQIELAREHLRVSERSIAEAQEKTQAEAKELFAAICGR